MKYILSPHIALRSWLLVPYAYYVKGLRNAKGLKKDEYEFLCLCDGINDIDESDPMVEQFRRRGMITPAEDGDTLTDWQKPRFCYNRYFPAANWSITGKCNYNCIHCFMAADNAPRMQSFSREEWQKTLADLDRAGVQTLTLTGGEPMLHPDFMDICREIYRRGMVLEEVTTNGSFITAEKLNALREMGADPLFKISFDCIGFHDWMRNKKGAEENALAAIKLCHEHGFRVRSQTNVNRVNISALYDTAIMLAELGVEEMRVIRTTEAPRWRDNAGDACFELSEYFDLMLDFTEKYAATGHEMEIDLWQFLQFYPTSRTYHYRPVEGGCHSFRGSAPVCRGNRGMIAINADGYLVPCLQMSGYYEKNNIRLGNVKTDDLQLLLRTGAYIDAVTCSINTLYEKNEKCNTCEYKKLCAGGCRAIATALTDDYLGIDPSKCMFYKMGYMQKIDEAFERVKAASSIVYRNTDDVTE